jgi:hypothetical protein
MESSKDVSKKLSEKEKEWRKLYISVHNHLEKMSELVELSEQPFYSSRKSYYRSHEIWAHKRNMMIMARRVLDGEKTIADLEEAGRRNNLYKQTWDIIYKWHEPVYVTSTTAQLVEAVKEFMSQDNEKRLEL